jgi:hypothetical protein
MNKELPSSEIIPHTVHTIRHIPTEPECSRADPEETKIPEPIITAKIRLMAENRPSSRLSWTPSLVSAFGLAIVPKIYNLQLINSNKNEFHF